MNRLRGLKWLALLALLSVGLACARPTPTPTPLPTPTPAPVGEAPRATPTPQATPTPTPIPGVKYVLGMAAYRTGPFGRVGAPASNAVVDYINLVNKKGGIDGYKITLMDIETGYETPRGVEAYERSKAAGNLLAFIPFSTGITYAVTPKAFRDKVVLLHAAYGISAAADGTAFPYNFLAAPTYWSGEAVLMKYIAEQEGGEENLRGKKIAMVYLDIDYGRETLPLHEVLSQRLGYELIRYPIPWPGLEQSAVWTDIARRTNPDWVILRLWGESTPTALREALRVGYPMERIIGTYWSPTDADIYAFGVEEAKGVKKLEFVNTGTDIPIIQEILQELYGKGEGRGPRSQVGWDLYNRGVYGAAILVTGMRLAAKEFGHPLDGEKLAKGLEMITPEVLEREGLARLAPPVTLSPEDHEGGGFARVMEWDGSQFVPVTDWMTAYRDVVQDLVKQAAEKFREENPDLYR